MVQRGINEIHESVSTDFEEIYNANWPRIYRVCMGFVNDKNWAKDIAQDTFVSAWQNFSKFRHESSVGTWLFRIATNHCLRQLEKEKRIPKTAVTTDLPDKPAPDLEGQIAFLYKCIAALAEMDRIIIGLELEDINQDEIAAIVGISEVNTRVRISRIKAKLTEKMKNYER